MTKFNNSNISIFLLGAITLIAIIAFKLWDNKKPTDVMKQKIESQIMLYVKSGCRFCIMAKELLEENNIAYEVIDISSNNFLQQKLINQTGQTTVPFVFIKNKFIGGYSDLLALKNRGEI